MVGNNGNFQLNHDLLLQLEMSKSENVSRLSLYCRHILIHDLSESSQELVSVEWSHVQVCIVCTQLHQPGETDCVQHHLVPGDKHYLVPGHHHLVPGDPHHCHIFNVLFLCSLEMLY